MVPSVLISFAATEAQPSNIYKILFANLYNKLYKQIFIIIDKKLYVQNYYTKNMDKLLHTKFLIKQILQNQIFQTEWKKFGDQNLKKTNVVNTKF